MTIEQAWGVFESHAMGCDTCEGPLRQLLALLALDAPPSTAVADTVLAMCPEGQELVEAWDHLCRLALGRQESGEGDPGPTEISALLGPLNPHIHEQQARLDLRGMSADEVRTRIEALAQLTGEAFVHILQLPKERREAAIEAVVASYKRTGGVRAPEPAQGPPPRRICRNCGARIKNPTHELCNDCWRAESKAQQRRGFHVIPDDE